MISYQAFIIIIILFYFIVNSIFNTEFRDAFRRILIRYLFNGDATAACSRLVPCKTPRSSTITNVSGSQINNNNNNCTIYQQQQSHQYHQTMNNGSKKQFLNIITCGLKKCNPDPQQQQSVVVIKSKNLNQNLDQVNEKNTKMTIMMKFNNNDDHDHVIQDEDFEILNGNTNIDRVSIDVSPDKTLEDVEVELIFQNQQKDKEDISSLNNNYSSEFTIEPFAFNNSITQSSENDDNDKDDTEEKKNFPNQSLINSHQHLHQQQKLPQLHKNSQKSNDSLASSTSTKHMNLNFPKPYQTLQQQQLLDKERNCHNQQNSCCQHECHRNNQNNNINHQQHNNKQQIRHYYHNNHSLKHSSNSSLNNYLLSSMNNNINNNNNNNNHVTSSN